MQFLLFSLSAAAKKEGERRWDRPKRPSQIPEESGLRERERGHREKGEMTSGRLVAAQG